jgi:hypothetical protein
LECLQNVPFCPSISRGSTAITQRALFHQVRKSLVTRLRELAEPRRRAALVCFLWQSYRDAVDPVDMFDKLLTRAHTQA